MFIMHSFTVETPSGSKKSPMMGTGDIVQLKKLFPNNCIWKSKTGPSSNINHPTMEEAKVLYNAMVRYYAKNNVSGETYQTGNFTGSLAVTSNLRSVFDELLAWFENDLGFKCSKKLKDAISKKQAKYKEEKEKDDADYQQKSIEFFMKLGVFHPVVPFARSMLETKLGEYKKRMEEWYFQPPTLRITDRNYRDTRFKILLAQTMLKATEDVSIVELSKKQMEELGDYFYAEEFFNACGVISVYLGTPFEGIELALPA